MTAFVCIFDRSGAELDPAQVRRLAEPLANYGSRLTSVCRGPLAVALWHGTGDGGETEHGPVVEPATGQIAALAGRLALVDGRSAAAAQSVGSAKPDWASLAREALRRPDRCTLADVAGSFVLIAADPRRLRMSLARDHLGDLKAYYHLGPRWFIAASEPAAILRHEAVADGLDESAAARFLGFRFFHSEQSFFRQIRELPPAHLLRVTARDCEAKRYWRLQLDPGGAQQSRQRLLAAFRSHLESSMAGQTAGLTPDQIALSLSGGLDSTTLAALAPAGVKSFSWRFGDGPSDERRNIETVAERLGSTIRWVDGEGSHPLCDGFAERFSHANSPHVNAFAALKHRLYGAARAAGCRLVMVGDAGDALYEAREYWLRDSLVRRAPGALASLARTMRASLGGDRSARRALRRLAPLPAVRRALPRWRMPWLTKEALSLLPAAELSPILPEVRWKRRHDLVAGAKQSELESEEQRLFAQCSIGRSSPYRYWPLLQMVIGLPAWWLHRDGRSKVLTIEAMRGSLPESVLDSGTVGLLGWLFLRGIEARRADLRETVFRRPRSDWQRYVRRSWLEPYLDATEPMRFGHTILWRVICYELWQQRLLEAG